MRCLYEALFCIDEEGICHGSIPDIECCWASGNSYEETLGLLVKYLEDHLADLALSGYALPAASFGRRSDDGVFSTVLSVHVAEPEPDETVSASRAAELLGVSRPRVTVLFQKGLLDGYHEGRNLFIYLRSVQDRLCYYPHPDPTGEAESAAADDGYYDEGFEAPAPYEDHSYLESEAC